MKEKQNLKQTKYKCVFCQAFLFNPQTNSYYCPLATRHNKLGFCKFYEWNKNLSSITIKYLNKYTVIISLPYTTNIFKRYVPAIINGYKNNIKFKDIEPNIKEHLFSIKETELINSILANLDYKEILSKIEKHFLLK